MLFFFLVRSSPEFWLGAYRRDIFWQKDARRGGIHRRRLFFSLSAVTMIRCLVLFSWETLACLAGWLAVDFLGANLRKGIKCLDHC